MKKYTNAPLPFMGQKRRFLKELNHVLKQYPQDGLFVDLFGGSGLLSHHIKQQLPNANVIYNDYDNYFERLANIPGTNKLLAQIRLITQDLPKDKPIRGEARETILKLIEDAAALGFVDYITLSSSLLFSMNYATSLEGFKATTMYNVVKQNDYSAYGYLEGVKRVSCDYKELHNDYKDARGVVFLVDPPYLSTDVSPYKNHWKLSDYLDVLQVLEGTKYIYFTSNKSNIIELCDWIGNRTVTTNPFIGAVTKSVNVNMNYSSSYTDVMLYKPVVSHT